MAVAILLVAIAILLYTSHPKRDYTLSAALLIVAFTWLAIEIHLLRLVQDLVALAVKNWVDVLFALAAALLLVVPSLMLYIAIRDQIDNRAVAGAGHHSPGQIRNTVLNKFEQRVATLMALGYGRTQAEAIALQQMKRDMNHHPAVRETSKHHA